MNTTYKNNNKHTLPSTIHRVLALFLTFTVLLPSITPYNNLWANNNGPSAPEAASFEPVDATDMVNLLTGDFTYVLPLMNVPSPEGGYPISLAYHAGIAMDQEASWVGLGWNLNPGAINRSVNGYPDDYDHTNITEFFYDEGDTDTFYSLSLGYSLGVSVGVGLSWGSNQSLGGHVSVGYGVSDSVGVNATVGTNGASIGASVGIPGGLSLGASLSSDGRVSGSLGFNFDENGNGFRIGASSDGTSSIAFSSGGGEDGVSSTLGFNISSEGVSASLSVSTKYKGKDGKSLNASGGIGIGGNTSFSNTISQNDYTSTHSGFTIPLIVPTPVGIFSLSFGKQKIKYFASKKTQNLISGPLYFQNSIRNGIAYKMVCNETHGPNTHTTYSGVVFSKEEREDVLNRYGNCGSCSCKVDENVPVDAMMDIYEVPLSENDDLANNYSISYNNPSFPSYDKFNVQAQGLSGSIHAKLKSNGNLFGLSNRQTEDELDIKYAYDGSTNNYPSNIRFYDKPQFRFDNEITSYLKVGKANFNSLEDALNNRVEASEVGDLFESFDDSEGAVNSQMKTSNYVQYFSNTEIKAHIAEANGYLKPIGLGFDRSQAPINGIGAIKISATDGKTYHYSLPVYNHESITRTYGISANENFKGAGEHKAYLEKRQLEPYATHWLLTAVTGPDFVDNGDGIAGEGDLGYWTNFEYGLWTDAYIWKAPYGKDYLESSEDPDVKTWSRGRKQQYFLNKIKTRTHTALFFKSERDDDRSPYWKYESVEHLDDETNSQDGNDFLARFIVKEKKTLRLDKVVLVKNEDDISDVSYGNSSEEPSYFNYPNSSKINFFASYNNKNYILDWDDNWEAVLEKSIKSVCFEYTNVEGSLVRGTPNTGNPEEGRLTLKKAVFRGKKYENILPPYVFDYINDDTYRYNSEHANVWGYKYDRPEMWSMNEITTPQGGKIRVNYEQHNLKSATRHDLKAIKKGPVLEPIEEYDLEVDSERNLKSGDKVNLNVDYTIFEDFLTNRGIKYTYDGDATILKVVPRNNINNKAIITVAPSGKINEESVKQNGKSERDKIKKDSYIEVSFNFDSEKIFYNEGGIRVKSIETVQENQTILKSNYKYGKKNDGIGWVSYLPFASELQEEVPYSSELPAPKPMYEYVTHELVDTNNDVMQSTTYQYHVMNKKTPDKIEYGNLYSIEINKGKEEEHTEYRDDRPSQTVPAVTVKSNITEYTIKDNLNCLGQLLSVTNFNSEGHIINKITNDYFTPSEMENKNLNAGVVQESYQSYKYTKSFHFYEYFFLVDDYSWMINSSTRIKYPNLLKSSTELKGGLSYTTTFSDFDLISGQSKQTHSYSSTGLELKTESIPAFRKYPEMGSKADNIYNKNMLSQGAETLSYFKTPSDTNWQLVGADIKTWKSYSYDVTRYEYGRINTSTGPLSSSGTFGYRLVDRKDNIYRSHKTYAWKGELEESGSYKDFVPFNWDSGSQDAGWQKLSEITKYSDYSRPLETEDINGNKASNKMGDNYSKVFATCNAPYDAMFYASFENKADFDVTGTNAADYAGGLSVIDGEFVSESHSGKAALKTAANGNALYIRPKEAGSYKASLWMHNTGDPKNLILNNNSSGDQISHNPNEIVQAGDWIQLNYYFDVHQEGFFVLKSKSEDIIVDDFRMHPIESSMTSYVYNDWNELTYIFGPNNMGVEYEYDAAGRLIKTYTEVSKNGTTEGGFILSNETRQFYKN